MPQFTRPILASLLALGVFASLGASTQAAFIPVYGTGVNNDGTLTAVGSADGHYSIIAAPTGASTPVVGSNLPSTWTGDTSSSQWIGVQQNLSTKNPGGTYDYHTTFSLAGLDSASASIQGLLAADDKVTILLNGLATGYTNYGGFTKLYSFSLTSGFINGTNTLDFIVNNTNPNTPSGLQVEITSATAAVPEPASIVMVSLGGIAAVGMSRRRRRAAV